MLMKLTRRSAVVAALLALAACPRTLHAQAGNSAGTISPPVWHSDFRMFRRCPQICVSPRRQSEADQTVQYIIRGYNGVRFSGRTAMFEFFEEEPKGRYRITFRDITRSYSHDPDVRTWKEELTKVIDSPQSDVPDLPVEPSDETSPAKESDPNESAETHPEPASQDKFTDQGDDGKHRHAQQRGGNDDRV